MKNKWMKKILSIFLAMLMVLSVMPPMTVLAKSSFPKDWKEWDWKVVYITTDKDTKVYKGYYNASKKYIRIPHECVPKMEIPDKYNVKKGSIYSWFRIVKADFFSTAPKIGTTHNINLESYDGKILFHYRLVGNNRYNADGGITANSSTSELIFKNYSKNIVVNDETSIFNKSTKHIVSNNCRVKTLDGKTIAIPKGAEVTIVKKSEDGKYGLAKYKKSSVYYRTPARKASLKAANSDDIVSFWINLNYLYYVAPTITKPDPPTVTLKTAQDIPLGGLITVDWNTPTDAKYFTAILKDDSGKEIERYSNIYGNSTSFQSQKPGKYTVEVLAQNSEYTSDPGKLGKTITVHDFSTVTFLDEDGTELGKQKVAWGDNAVALIAPEKKGHTFKSWSGSLFGVKEDTTVTAEYDKAQYTVEFIGYQSDDKGIPSKEVLLKKETVAYGEDVTPPAESEIVVPKNYEFLGWSSDEYNNVYTPYKNESIKIYAVYGWKNKDLPVSCEITEAKRQANGYYVYYNLSNYPDAVTRGRAIVALKTSEGKLIDMTESSAFSLDKNETETGARIFVPCEKAATTAELYIVNGYTNNGMSDGIPISNKASSAVVEGKMWSDWGTEPIAETGDNEVDSRTEYSYRNIRETTGNTSVKPDWVTVLKDNVIKHGDEYESRLNDTSYIGSYTNAKRTDNSSSVGWSAWSWNQVVAFDTESKRRDVQTQQAVKSYNYKTMYDYYRWAANYTGGYSSAWQTSNHPNSYSYSFDYPLESYGTTSQGVEGFKYWYSSNYIVVYKCSQPTHQVQTSANYGTQYHYKDSTYTYYFYRWDNKDWSDWSADEVTATDKREVQTRTVYREKSVSAGIEDVSGELRHFNGNVGGDSVKKYVYYRYAGTGTGVNSYYYSSPNYSGIFSNYETIYLDTQLEVGGISANDGKTPYYIYQKDGHSYYYYFLEEKEVNENFGKNITFFVSKYNAISDFTDEYVAQGTVAEDGSYSFDYKLREEPSAETGDFTIMIGLEGATEKQVVGTIEAPKPVYTVKFYGDVKDNNPEVLYEATVRQGETVDLPAENPTIDGKKFICWNNSCTNVQSDLEVYPVFEDEEYTVIFVDWRKQTIETQKYKYGEALIPPVAGENGDSVQDEDGNYIEYAENIEVEDVDSGYGRGWDYEEGTLVTSDMVVEAVYETKTFDVTFHDYDGTVIDTQTVEYDGVAEAPELPDSEEDGVDYFDWNIEAEELYGVKENIDVFPSYEFDETTPNPTASVSTGAYDGAQTVSLSCEDENAVIYYTLDGTEPQDNFDALEYTAPITVDAMTQLRFYASSFGKNDSEVVTEYYVINNDGVIINMHDNVYGEEGVETYLADSLADFDDSVLELEGYTLEGVYSDADYTQPVAYDSDTTTKGEIDLYAKYNIDSYTVTFAYEDGSEIDTQIVNYAESAEAPAVEDEGNMKFVGWDSDEWNCVTEDITVHPVFKDESEIIDITFDRDKYQMEAGATYKINATITAPEEYEDVNDAVVWSSDNEEVATVDNTGEVTSLKAGTANIYATSVDDINMAVCEITVAPSVNNSIVLNNLSSLGVDSEGYLRKIPLDGTNTVDNISTQFVNANDQLTFTNAKGSVLSGADKIGTNTVISLMNGDEVLDFMTVVMTGDVTCDGIVNNRDVSYAARVIVKRNTADAGQLRAMDANGDGKVNNRDVALLSRYLVGKETINN